MDLSIISEQVLHDKMQKAFSNGRKAPREFRREQLIEATIATVARRGLSQITLNHVAKEAGVSHGLVNFHFQSKDRLLADTLAFMSDLHRRNWERALDEAGPAPGARLNALILAEFNEANQSPDYLSAWCAFWGEAQNRPLYIAQCAENDRAQVAAFETACADVIAEGGYGCDHRLAARVLRLAIEGVWLDLTLSPPPYELEEARRTAFFCAGTLFPRHFCPDGLISR